MLSQYIKAICTLLLLFFLDASSSQPHREIQCHDPDVGGTTQNKNRKFILFGADSSQGAGIGNLLIFFPAVYYFAAFSGRDIILGDSSIVGAYSLRGKFCNARTENGARISKSSLLRWDESYPDFLSRHK